MATIWQEVLGIEQVGRQDNFFELGGDSIISIQVVSRARRADCACSRDVFQQPALPGTGGRRQSARGDVNRPGPVLGTQTLTPVQQWFFDNQTVENQHWNQSVLLHVREPMDLLRLQNAVQQVLAQHDALRLQFRQVNGHWSGRYVPLDSAAATDLLWTAQVQSDEALQGLCDED